MASTSQRALVHSFANILSSTSSSICNDQRKLYAVLISEFPQRPAALVVLHAAVCSGIAKDVAQHSAELPQLLADRYAQRFVQQTGVSQDWAAWAVQSWARLGTVVEEQERILCQPCSARKKHVDFPPISRPIRSVDVVGHRRKITDLQFSPNGRWLVSSSVDRSIRVWDPRDGQQQHSWGFTEIGCDVFPTTHRERLCALQVMMVGFACGTEDGCQAAS